MRKDVINMDYEKLNKIIDDCINKDGYKEFFEVLYNIVLPICKSFIKENNYQPVTSNNYSIDYNLNDKLKLISKFLKEIDLGLHHQFETIISSLDENKNPLVSFTYSEKKQNSHVKSIDGKTYITFNNNLNDIFVIIHEIIHCMNNYSIKIVNGEKTTTCLSYFKTLFNESAPIIAEKLFGQWLVKNNYITQNDLNLRINKIINITKDYTKCVIMESIYIKLKQDKINISEATLRQYKGLLDKNSIECRVVEEELKNKLSIKSILSYDKLKFPSFQKYIFAVDMLKNFNLDEKGIKNFLKIHNLLGDINTKDKDMHFNF